jgi:hypothetical protein
MLRTGFMVAAAVSVVIARSGWAQVPTPTCLQQAKSDYLDCKNQCKSDFVDAHFACKNVNPQCGLACLDGREACFEGVKAILETGQRPDGSTLANCSGGTDACTAALDDAKAACGAPCQPSDTACQDCVDNAQVQDFECRDACRDSWRADPTVIAMKQSCRSAFKACLGRCTNQPR